MAQRLILVVLGLTLLVITACGGGDEADLPAAGGEASQGEEPPQSAEAVSDQTGATSAATAGAGENDLTIMVLPADELGGLATRFAVDPDSGFQSNEAAAAGSIDPDDSAADLAALGRINGYQLSYEATDFGALVAAGQGLRGVQTLVTLFRDAEGASAWLRKRLADFERYEGAVVGEAVLSHFDTFSVGNLGDEAGGFRVAVRAQGFEFELFATAVYFRLDRITALAGILHLDDRDMTVEAEAFAHSLDERIRAVLRGEISEGPVPIPLEGEEAAASLGARPAEVPDLAAMALGLADLPAGVTIAREGYVEDPTGVATYGREFDPAGVDVGSTLLIGLNSSVDLYESAAEASLFLDLLERIGVDDIFVAEVFEALTSIDVEDVEIASRPLDFGDQALLVTAALQTAVGEFTSAFVVLRVNSVIGRLLAIGPAADFHLQDVLPLAEAMADRMLAASR